MIKDKGCTQVGEAHLKMVEALIRLDETEEALTQMGRFLNSYPNSFSLESLLNKRDTLKQAINKAEHWRSVRQGLLEFASLVLQIANFFISPADPLQGILEELKVLKHLVRRWLLESKARRLERSDMDPSGCYSRP